MDDLENTVAALKSEFQKTLNDKTENQKSLEENLAAAKHDLLRVQEQLSMAEKVRTYSRKSWLLLLMPVIYHVQSRGPDVTR